MTAKNIAVRTIIALAASVTMMETASNYKGLSAYSPSNLPNIVREADIDRGIKYDANRRAIGFAGLYGSIAGAAIAAYNSLRRERE
ncbi:hypothetical protein ACFLZX_02825 [Nanoarchaeota archaeon]